MSHPSAKEARQSHASLTALGTPGAAADFASNDQGTNTALRQVVMRRNARDGDKDKQFWQKALHSLAERLMGDFLLHKGLTECPQLLLEGVLLGHANLLKVAWSQLWVRTLRGASDRIIIDRFDVLGPGEQCLMLRNLLLEIMHIAQEMDPTALMQPLMDVGSSIKIAAQHALEILADQPFDNFPRTGVMGLVRAYCWRTHAPDLSVEAIFSPARLIGLHCWTRTDGRLEIIEHGLGMRNESVEHLHDFSHAHLKAVGSVSLSVIPK